MIRSITNGSGWLGSLHRFHDWTRDCIAMTNQEIEAIWKMAPNGTAVEIASQRYSTESAY
ncbi:MAG: L,D-transpeptidase [Deltaproteobacteria bacterium]|nr:L,D-transpeptidase [Deltaproteobacteria bacterium]